MCIITQVGPDMRAVGRVAGNMARYIYMEIIYMYRYVCVYIYIYLYTLLGGGLAMRVVGSMPGLWMYLYLSSCFRNFAAITCIYI
jgi:hypothetical protein